jgi:hypothetical protein
MRPYSKTVYPTGTINQVVPSVFTTVPPQGDTDATGIRSGSRPQPAEQALYDIPLTSAIVKEVAATTCFTCAQRGQWARHNLPSRIQVALATPLVRTRPHILFLLLSNFDMFCCLFFDLASCTIVPSKLCLTLPHWHDNSMESSPDTERWISLRSAPVFPVTAQLPA